MKKILIIDNNRTIVELLASSFKNAGYTPIKAFDGMEALDHLKQNKPDLIVLDLIMPKIDGYRLAKYLKSDPEYSYIPIIVLSGIAAEDSSQMYEVEADAFIAKGKIEDTFHHLMTTIKWLESRKPSTPPILGMENMHPREMTQELLLVKQHFDSMLQVMGEGVIEMDDKHRVFFSNQAACQLIGVSEIELFGKTINEIFPDNDKIEGYLNKLPSSRKTIKPGVNLKLGERILHFLATPFYFNQAYIGSIAILEDITNQYKKEAALEELTSSIFHLAPIGIGLLDNEQRVALANKHLQNLSQDKNDITHRILHDVGCFASPIFADILQQALLLSAGNSISQELTFADLEGRTRTYHITATPLLQQDGKPFVLLLVEDITLRAELQRQLMATNKELETANQAKSNFLSIVSHELRTPLSVIRGYISLILEGRIQGVSGEALDALRTSDKRARHLQQLIEELLDISRIEAGKTILRNEVIVLSKHIKEVVDMFSGDMKQKRITLDMRIPANLPEIVADHNKIHQIFTNLVSNAIKFTPEGGTITIIARHNDDTIAVAVQDTGIGIPEDKLQLIFNRFYQVDSTDTRLYSGAGLGLSIVKMIVDAMGGRIEVESTPGSGSSFTVYFSIGPVDEMKAEKSLSESSMRKRSAQPSRKSSILLCEDDEDTVKIVGYTLPAEDYELIVCRNCLEAIEKLYTNAVDLVMVDIRLPIISGYDFIRMIKAAERTSDIPIFILTAAGQEEDIKMGHESGANEYIIKPFNPSELLEKIAKYLGAKPSP